MLNMIISCLLTLMLAAASVLAQSLSQPNYPKSCFAQKFINAPLFNSPQSAPPGMREYLQRWLNPIAARSPVRSVFSKRKQGTIKKKAWEKFNLSPWHSLTGVRETWVQHYASGLAACLDEVTAMAVDGAGNVYVTGYGANLPFEPDYLTIKYNAAGHQVWTARYNGPADGADLAMALHVDDAGNVYVTGSSAGSGTDYDCTTIKYNAAGVEQWVARYNGSGNAADWGITLAGDATSNVYVTGTSAGSSTASDYVTIQYNASGVEQWAARYNGPGNADDEVTALVVDESGSAYVTGTSIGAGTKEDYATIKYNSAGDQQWVARYNGPSDNNSEEAAGLVIDRVGNVYVTGTSEGAGTIEDYTTIKYNAEGEQQWIARYNGPGDYDVAAAIAIDNFGNVYVTGASDSVAFNADYATVKYNNAGEQQWVARYNGPGDDADEATAVVVDASGNVYVMGSSFGSGTERDFATVKYDSFGAPQWAVRYNDLGNNDDEATALAVDVSGNIYVAGTSDGLDTFSDYATLKYSNAGAEQWRVLYNSLGNADDRAAALAVDAFGNVYVTGTSRRLGTSDDYLTLKFNASGIMQWMARYNSPNNGGDEPAAIAVDDDGNVYVTGKSAGADSAFDYATIKYNPTGTELWVNRYNGPVNADDYATALTIDHATSGSNVYVTGGSQGAITTARDYATIKYNSAGVEQWIARYDGKSSADDQAAAIKVDASGNVYVTGSSNGAGTAWDYATIKYNSGGEAQWAARYNGSGNNDDMATALAMDASGNIYVTGNSVGAGTFADYVTIKYNSAGAEQWAKRYDDPDRPFNMATALAVDGMGNVHVTGTSWGAFTAFDYATIKYNAAGEQHWAASYNGPDNSADEATALALDDSGNVYVTGWSVGVGTFSDFATIKYNAAGAEQWVARYNRSGTSLDYAAALAVDSAAEGRNVYVAGWSEGEHWSMFTIIKYAQTPTVSVKNEEPTQPRRYVLSQNFPNPLNPSTKIRYALPKAGYVKLKVFNLLGEEVATLVSDHKPAGEHEVLWNPTDLPGGIYLYRLQIGGSPADSKHDYVETRKLILLP